MSQQLRVILLLQKTQVWFPALIHLRCFKTPCNSHYRVGSEPLASIGTCTYVYTFTHRDKHLHIGILFLLSNYSWAVQTHTFKPTHLGGKGRQISES